MFWCNLNLTRRSRRGKCLFSAVSTFQRSQLFFFPFSRVTGGSFFCCTWCNSITSYARAVASRRCCDRWQEMHQQLGTRDASSLREEEGLPELPRREKEKSSLEAGRREKTAWNEKERSCQQNPHSGSTHCKGRISVLVLTQEILFVLRTYWNIFYIVQVQRSLPSGSKSRRWFASWK